jgi:hypothetical protein
MTRLNNATRAAMAASAVRIAGIDEGFANLRKRRAALASGIRIDSLGGATGIEGIQKDGEAAKALAEADNLKKVKGFNLSQPTRCYELFQINLAGMRCSLQFNGDLLEGQTDHDERAFECPVPRGDAVAYPAGHKFVEEFLSLEADRKALLARKEGIELQVAATLNQFTTVEKLLEAWPEASELIPKELSGSALPVVLTKDLNCLIGLPS